MRAAVISTLLAGAAAQESQCLGSAGSYGNDKTCLRKLASFRSDSFLRERKTSVTSSRSALKNLPLA